VLFWERRYDEAYKQLSKVIAMDAEFSEGYLWRGGVLLQQGKYPAAIADLETAHLINHASQIISPTLAYAYGGSFWKSRKSKSPITPYTGRFASEVRQPVGHRIGLPGPWE
jgi:tetratricopeptide (TPR) repeat protein